MGSQGLTCSTYFPGVFLLKDWMPRLEGFSANGKGAVNLVLEKRREESHDARWSETKDHAKDHLL